MRYTTVASYIVRLINFSFIGLSVHGGFALFKFIAFKWIQLLYRFFAKTFDLPGEFLFLFNDYNLLLVS